MKDFIEIEQKDLVLEVDYDCLILDLDKWDNYLDFLCQNREYQKIAIKTAIRYLIGGKYENLLDLAKKNYDKSKIIRDSFPKEKEYLKKFEDFSDKLWANVDLATGSGKSYVMYGISQILLSLQVVDKVLLLCPSLTIKEGLTKKFIELSSKSELTKRIPEGLNYCPSIIQADQTMTNFSVCIENIHSVYNDSQSSIKDNLTCSGERILVLNDESHHIFNKEHEKDKALKKWAEFLLDKNNNFKYMLGFTGTAYQGNNYFCDVIFRYSLKQAVESGVLKKIEYIQSESETIKKEDEKFQIIYQTHLKNKEIYQNIKPLTIMVTKDISTATNLSKKFTDFLLLKYRNENGLLDIEESVIEKIKKSVLLITYKSIEEDKELLKNVDDKESNVEWIISVSMLSEGWDVQNVFQIVPMEEKAFNSKLLISQILGRGLRKPINTIDPKVIVMNHESWGKSIKSLVDEILELETRVIILNCNTRKNFNFDLHQINNTKEEFECENISETTKTFNYSKMITEGVSLEAQSVIKKVSIEFKDLNDDLTSRSYTVSSHTWTIEEILDKLYEEFKFRHWEGVILKIGDDLFTKEKLPERDFLKKIILTSMSARGIVGDKIIDKNAQRIFSSFSTLLRKNNKKIEIRTIYNDPYIINTDNANQESFGLSGFRNKNCLFYSNDYQLDISDSVQLDILNEFITGGYPYSKINVRPELFKTPSNLVVSSSEPEKKFISCLIDKDNAKFIDSWIKSKNKGFYSIEYNLRSGLEDARNREYKILGFNPDFFIKCKYNNKTYILVNEIKDDKDDSKENKAKYKFAKIHFEILNKKLKDMGIDVIYIFHMLSPQAYTTYFDYLKNGTLFQSQEVFKCELECLLES